MTKKPQMTRRHFLVRAAQGATSMAALPLSGLAQTPAPDKMAVSNGKVITRTLGRTGIHFTHREHGSDERRQSGFGPPRFRGRHASF